MEMGKGELGWREWQVFPSHHTSLPYHVCSGFVFPNALESLQDQDYVLSVSQALSTESGIIN
jgi:hypothetical protein